MLKKLRNISYSGTPFNIAVSFHVLYVLYSNSEKHLLKA